MLESSIIKVIIFISTFLSSVGLTYLCIKIARKFNLVDQPNERKIHKDPVPYLGGAGIYFAFIINLLICILIQRLPEINLYEKNVIGLFISSFIIFVLGLFDDINGVHANFKFIVQIIAALILVKFGYLIDRITNPLGGVILFPYWFSVLVTVFWIVSVINAINLLDGLDGLASGVISVAAFFIFIISSIANNGMVQYMSLILLAANLGFLIFNFPPAKIFMGDAGSMFLGFIFSLLAILGNRKSAMAINLLIPIVLLSLPILDTLMAIIRRANMKKNIFLADKEHIHHRLIALGIPYRKVIILIYIICCYLGTISLLSLWLPNQFIFILFIVVGINVFIGLYVLKLVEDHVSKPQ